MHSHVEDIRYELASIEHALVLSLVSRFLLLFTPWCSIGHRDCLSEVEELLAALRGIWFKKLRKRGMRIGFRTMSRVGSEIHGHFRAQVISSTALVYLFTLAHIGSALCQVNNAVETCAICNFPKEMPAGTAKPYRNENPSLPAVTGPTAACLHSSGSDFAIAKNLTWTYTATSGRPCRPLNGIMRNPVCSYVSKSL
jgi:hypothetical protein